MEIQIRKERPEDRQQVYDLVRSAFENVEESDHTEHLLVERLRMSDAFIPELSLVAVIRDGNNSSAEMTVGHILLTKIEIVASDGRSWPSLAVAPLSVLPGFQRMGIGGMLIREAHRKAAALGLLLPCCSAIRTTIPVSATGRHRDSASDSPLTPPMNAASP